jgi:ABC-type siderophore export system fused ATPase/permease subunit
MIFWKVQLGLTLVVQFGFNWVRSRFYPKILLIGEQDFIKVSSPSFPFCLNFVHAVVILICCFNFYIYLWGWIFFFWVIWMERYFVYVLVVIAIGLR